MKNILKYILLVLVSCIGKNAFGQYPINWNQKILIYDVNLGKFVAYQFANGVGSGTEFSKVFKFADKSPKLKYDNLYSIHFVNYNPLTTSVSVNINGDTMSTRDELNRWINQFFIFQQKLINGFSSSTGGAAISEAGNEKSVSDTLAKYLTKINTSIIANKTNYNFSNLDSISKVLKQIQSNQGKSVKVEVAKLDEIIAALKNTPNNSKTDLKPLTDVLGKIVSSLDSINNAIKTNLSKTTQIAPTIESNKCCTELANISEQYMKVLDELNLNQQNLLKLNVVKDYMVLINEIQYNQKVFGNVGTEKKWMKIYPMAYGLKDSIKPKLDLINEEIKNSNKEFKGIDINSELNDNNTEIVLIMNKKDSFDIFIKRVIQCQAKNNCNTCTKPCEELKLKIDYWVNLKKKVDSAYFALAVIQELLNTPIRTVVPFQVKGESTQIDLKVLPLTNGILGKVVMPLAPKYSIDYNIHSIRYFSTNIGISPGVVWGGLNKASLFNQYYDTVTRILNLKKTADSFIYTVAKTQLKTLPTLNLSANFMYRYNTWISIGGQTSLGLNFHDWRNPTFNLGGAIGFGSKARLTVGAGCSWIRVHNYNFAEGSKSVTRHDYSNNSNFHYHWVNAVYFNVGMAIFFVNRPGLGRGSNN